MNKNFVKSLVLSSFLVIGLVSNECCGMDVKTLVGDLAKDPSNKTKLTELVKLLVDPITGKKCASQLIDDIEEVQVGKKQKGCFKKISCMISDLYYDWGGGYQCIHEVNYYVDGAYDGFFGPYIFGDEKCS